MEESEEKQKMEPDFEDFEKLIDEMEKLRSRAEEAEKKLEKAEERAEKLLKRAEKAERESEMLRQDLIDCRGELRECEDFILRDVLPCEEPEVESEVQESEVEVPEAESGEGIVESGDDWLLPTIPEEDPGSIPDYYDECIRYADSLKFAIGSDFEPAEPQLDVGEGAELDNLLDNPAEVAEQAQAEDREAGGMTVVEQVGQRKRKQKFKLLYSAAWW